MQQKENMLISLPYTIYEKLEEKLGKENAHAVAESLESIINESFRQAQEKQKYEITDELKKELASKHDIQLVKVEVENLRKEMDDKINYLKREMDNKIDYKIELVRKELRIIFLTLTFLMIFLNQNSLEIIGRLLGILK